MKSGESLYKSCGQRQKADEEKKMRIRKQVWEVRKQWGKVDEEEPDPYVQLKHKDAKYLQAQEIKVKYGRVSLVRLVQTIGESRSSTIQPKHKHISGN